MKTSSLIGDVMGSVALIPHAKLGKVSAKLHAAIEQWPTSYHIKRLIQWNWFLKPFSLGVHFLSAQDVVAIERKNQNLKQGYLQIGDCPNGDRVYLKESDFSVWYWCHEEARDWDVVEKKALHMVYPSLDLLLMAVASVAFVPRDSYSGRDYALVLNFKRR